MATPIQCITSIVQQKNQSENPNAVHTFTSTYMYHKTTSCPLIFVLIQPNKTNPCCKTTLNTNTQAESSPNKHIAKYTATCTHRFNPNKTQNQIHHQQNQQILNQSSTINTQINQ